MDIDNALVINNTPHDEKIRSAIQLKSFFIKSCSLDEAKRNRGFVTLCPDSRSASSELLYYFVKWIGFIGLLMNLIGMS